MKSLPGEKQEKEAVKDDVKEAALKAKDAFEGVAKAGATAAALIGKTCIAITNLHPRKSCIARSPRTQASQETPSSDGRSSYSCWSKALLMTAPLRIK